MGNLAMLRDAHHHYRFIHTWEAGIVLNGSEVKSVKLGHVSLKSNFVKLENAQLIAYNINISPYPPARAHYPNLDPNRPRRLILKKSELYALADQLVKGRTLIILALYTKGGLIKASLSLVEGKKKFDKRAEIKKREMLKATRSATKSFLI